VKLSIKSEIAAVNSGKMLINLHGLKPRRVQRISRAKDRRMKGVKRSFSPEAMRFIQLSQQRPLLSKG
jgi:hypothetical protein